MNRIILTVLLSTCWFGMALLADESPSRNDAPPTPEGLAFFEEHIRPLLQKRCYECHSAEAKDLHANLYLDSREGWQKGGDSGPALLPGKPLESLLATVLSYSDDAPTQMPPSGKLPDDELALINRWIEIGAPDPRIQATKHSKQRTIDLDTERKHWAYQPLISAMPPDDRQLVGADIRWIRTAIDRFILDKLRAESIVPNGPADKYKLIRRAYLDLIGLPPAPADVDAFVNDNDSQAYERVIDKLLASQHYGERWGRHWLDIARFAESHGFEQDYDRPNAYHYRDFVIRALNADMPFDQFLKWQLAGDELAPHDTQAIAATGFLAAGVHATQITANQAEKERYDELDDMARTVGTTMLGLTVGCARCHDHKFDPIPNADYYGMVSTFTTTVRSDFDVRTNPVQDAEAIAKYEAEHAPLVAKLQDFDHESSLSDRFDSWRKTSEATTPTWLILDPAEFVSVGGATLTKLGDGSFLATGTNPDFDTYRIIARTDVMDIKAIRMEALADPSMVNSGPGRANNGNFDLTNLTFIARPIDKSGPPLVVALKNPRATFEQGPHLGVALVLDDVRSSGWAVDPQFGKDHAAVFDTNEPIGFKGGTELEVTLEFNGNQRHNIGRTRLSITNSTPPVAVEIGGDLASIQEILTALGDRSLREASNKHRKLLLDWYKPRDKERQALVTAIETHAKSMPQPTTVKMLICSEGVPAVRLHTQGPDFYDKTFVLKRGDPNQKENEAEQRFLTVLMNHPAGPAHWTVLPPAGAKTSFRRSSMANWLTDVEHGAGGLAARVIVNRLWQHHFGRGLVATPSDFGTQGARPSHPELLDYLATSLIQGGWKLKDLHKQMMLSATYMQSSTADDARLLADHSNTRFWRYAPRRLEAESIRDSLLAVSNKLDPTPFGPGTLDMNMKRRSIYFFVKRSQLIPMLSLFDAPDALQDLAQRTTTTVAPQALLMMNNAIVRGYAEGLAMRVKPSANGVLDDQIRSVYRYCFSREPSAEEMGIAIDFLREQAADYATSAAANADQLAFVDWCQAVMSLNEFVFVD